jgi:hypothetical protein
MSSPINPINPGPVNGVQFNPDQAHGPWPTHMDVRTNLAPELPGVQQKLRIDSSGNILSDNLEFGNRFLNDIINGR